MVAFVGPSCRDRAPGLPSSSSMLSSQAEVSDLNLRRRAAEEGGISTGRFIKDRMLSHADYERPVT